MDINRKIKISGLIIGILLFIVLISGFSYAYYSSVATDTSSVKGTAGCFVVDHVKGNNVTGNVILFDESKIITNNNITVKDGMQLTYVTAGINNACTIDGYMIMKMNVKTLNSAFITGESKGAFKYAIAKYSPTTYTSPSISTLKNKSFEIIKTASITSTGEQTILTKQLPHSTKDGYLIIFYIDGDKAFNDAGNTSFSATITAEASQGNAPEKASALITNLYNNSTKTPVKNNSITYQYDTTNNLMQDTAGNIRYYGASPNNYIYFNCDSYPSTNCELWRIIGVFDGKIKLMRNKSIGDMAYDDDRHDTYLQQLTSNDNNSAVKMLQYDNDSEVTAKLLAVPDSGDGQNDYSSSSLQKILNNYYYNKLNYTGTITYDFTNTGIKNDTTRNMIAETTWNLGGWDTSNIYSNVMYEKERGTTVISNPSDGITRTTTWTGKIALAYPSDYGFATDLSKCSQTLSNYDSSTDSYACRNNDWMYSIITNSGSGYGWLLTPSSSDAYVAFNVNSRGYVGSHNDVINYVYIKYGVAPVLYLGSDQDIVAGDGSQSNPYKLTGN